MLTRHIFLIGMPGSGKSSLGKRVAGAMRIPYVDTDGRIVDGVGWVDGDYLGIDQGPIVIMTENHRSEFVWRYMRGEPNIRRALDIAGFTGGWMNG